ncbi:MAG: PAS domain S-box protein [Bacteroidales bacterium]
MKKLKKLILVEDELITAKMLSKQLSDKGYEIKHFMSGEDAINAVLKTNIDFELILMDIDLGQGIDGTSAAKTILDKKDIPIVFLSSHTSSDVVAKTEAITSYGYIYKNAGIAVIDASIKMALRLFEAKKEIERHKNELKDSEEKYRNLTENISDVLWTTNLNLETTYVSASVEKVLGETVEGHLNKKTEEKFPPESLNYIKSALKEELDKENDPDCDKTRTRMMEVQHYGKKGNMLWVSINVSGVRDKKGKLIGFQGVTRDITQQKEAEIRIQENNRRFSAILSAIPDIMFIFSKDGVFLDYHSAERDKLLLDPKDFIGKKAKDILPEYLAKKNQEVITKLFKTNKPQSYSYSIEANGNKRHFDARMVKYGEDKALSIVRDITEQFQTKEELKLSHETYKGLLNNISEAIYVLDKKSVFIDVNETATKFYGYSKSEIIGQKPDFLLTPELNNLDEIKKHISKAFKGQTQIFEVWAKYKNGKISPKELSLSKGHYFGEEVLIAVERDISERKKALEAIRKSEEKYRLIFEKSPIGIIHFDKNSTITECNDYFNKKLKSQLIGNNIKETNNKELLFAIKRVLKGKSSAFEGNIALYEPKQKVPTRILFSPVFNNEGKTQGGIALIEDRSSQIEKENLEKQIAIAKESARFKQNFLANMSHEIRTPLTGMLGFTEMLYKTRLSVEQKSYLDILKHSGENLKEIINLILDYSKIESGEVKLKYNNFRSDSLFNSPLNLYSSICHKGVEIKTHIDSKIPHFIKTDQHRVTQIVNNLLSNAVKFTEEGTISLKATLEKSSKNNNDLMIRVEVSDTGIGIAPETQDYLFKPFTQIETKQIRTIEGTGLGLAICKELAKILKGEIGVISKKDKGSTFWFTFTAKKAEKSDIKHSENTDLEQDKKPSAINILLVDDKKINQMVVTIMLESMGHRVDSVSNGEEALRKYQPGVYDLILMDIQMPVMDGITATNMLKEKYKNLPPIVGLSANAFEGDRSKFMKQGMDEYLTKPVKSDDFKDLLNRLFNNANN